MEPKFSLRPVQFPTKFEYSANNHIMLLSPMSVRRSTTPRQKDADLRQGNSWSGSDRIIENGLL
jgi:hypothetical protein